MRTVDLIRAKRDGGAAEPREIEAFIRSYVNGEIPDYQVSAWLMAVFFRGMSKPEMTALTLAMMRSGDVYDLKRIPGVKADKHSTGGVGDKVSLILAPLAAACGLIVPMVSGRGLGHTGGTLDKLEAIPGFSTKLSKARFMQLLGKIGLAMGGQTKSFVPADRLLYALRDVTATVESIPLIAASIMSKKMAEGCEALVLDVKTGNGAFMQKQADAVKLAKTLVGIGRGMGRKVSALITDMNQTLGRAVGNANEVAESIDCLKGGGPEDLMIVTRALTGRMLTLGGLARGAAQAEKMMSDAIASGRALEKFRDFVREQGGDPKIADDPRRLPQAPRRASVKARRSGAIKSFDTRGIGIAASVLGAGRAVKTDVIDPGVGFIVKARIGDRVKAGQEIFEIQYRSEAKMAEARRMLEACFDICDGAVARPKLVKISDV